MAGYKHLNVTIDKENPDEGVREIVKELKSNWTKDKISIQVLSGGYLNKTLKVVHDNNNEDGLIVRIDGTVPHEVGLSRLREIKFLRHINAYGVGVPLLASFQNGSVSKLMSGLSVEADANIMRDPTFAGKAAQAIADIHHTTPKDSEPKASDGTNSSLMSLGKHSISLLRKLKDTDFVKQFIAYGADFDEIEKELDLLYSELVSLKTPVGLAHNDIWMSNMLHDKEKDLVTLIDYEMIDFNFLTYDLASYLTCLVGLPPDMSKRATPEFSKAFIKVYLERLAELDGNPSSSVTENEIEKYFVWTCKSTLLFLLFGSVYNFYIGYNQNQDGVDIDFAGLCILMYSEYKSQKEEYSVLKLPE